MPIIVTQGKTRQTVQDTIKPPARATGGNSLTVSEVLELSTLRGETRELKRQISELKAQVADLQKQVRQQAPKPKASRYTDAQIAEIRAKWGI